METHQNKLKELHNQKNELLMELKKIDYIINITLIDNVDYVYRHLINKIDMVSKKPTGKKIILHMLNNRIESNIKDLF
jgi:hypothetical protein